MERQITLGDVIAPAKVLRCDNDDYPVLSMTMHDGIVLQSDRFKKSLASIDQSNYKVVLRGQLVVGFPIDEGVIYVQNITEAGIMSPAYGVWNIYSKEIMPEYLELCLHSPQSMDYYKNKLRGTTARRRSITTGDLLALPITLPSLTEQKRRISLLKQATLLLNSQKQAMLKFDELVKSRFIELFGDPQRNPHGYKHTKLSDIATYYNGLTYKPENVAAEGAIVLRSSNIQNSQLDFADTVRVDCAIKERLMVQKNDILMCSRNGSAKLVGKVALIKDIQEPMSFGAFMMIIRSHYFGYLMTYFQMDAFRQQIKTGATTTINQITGRMLDDVTIPLPPMSLVDQFATFVEQTDKSKLAVKQSLEKLETLKKSLMQQYFG